MAVSVRVILYPVELRVWLVTIVLNTMLTATTPCVASVIVVATVTVTRVIVPAVIAPVVATHTIHVVLMLGIVTSFTCKHLVTTWVTVTRVGFILIYICIVFIA
jgi:hypothetical protein